MQVSIKIQNLFPLNSFFLNYESVSSTLKKGGGGEDEKQV